MKKQHWKKLAKVMTRRAVRMERRWREEMDTSAIWRSYVLKEKLDSGKRKGEGTT